MIAACVFAIACAVPPPRYDCWPNLCVKAQVTVIDTTVTPTYSPCAGYPYIACTVRVGERWVIFITRYPVGWTKPMILRHEYGHVNGWPENHPY